MFSQPSLFKFLLRLRLSDPGTPSLPPSFCGASRHMVVCPRCTLHLCCSIQPGAVSRRGFSFLSNSNVPSLWWRGWLWTTNWTIFYLYHSLTKGLDLSFSLTKLKIFWRVEIRQRSPLTLHYISSLKYNNCIERAYLSLLILKTTYL